MQTCSEAGSRAGCLKVTAQLPGSLASHPISANACSLDLIRWQAEITTDLRGEHLSWAPSLHFGSCLLSFLKWKQLSSYVIMVSFYAIMSIYHQPIPRSSLLHLFPDWRAKWEWWWGHTMTMMANVSGGWLCGWLRHFPQYFIIKIFITYSNM